MPFEANTSVSHYRILSKIGEGGMGEVYRAQDEVLERDVALKILSEQCCRESDRLTRFIREAKASSALNHPNIITIFEFGAVGDTHFIASELIEGDTLGSLLQQGRIELPAALRIAVQVASALQAAHAAGIVHRDIKPDNVMVRPDGIVKVLDFGVAKLLEGRPALPVRTEDATRLKVDTSPGMIIGTANYMSPEQAAGKPVDPRSDIFSFGVVLYEMISGRCPFEGDTPMEMLAAVLYKEAAPLGALAPNAPPELCGIVAKAMAKDPDERFGSMSDLIAELAPLAGMDVTGFSGGTGSGGATDAVTRILEVPATGETSPPEATRKTSEPTRGLARSFLKHWLAAAAVLLAVTLGGLWYAFRDTGGQIDTVAVLPFMSQQAGEENDALADGLTESLISGLSRLPGLTVRARSSVFRFKGADTDPAKAAAELNVRAVVIGRISQTGDRLSLYVEVVDTELDKVVWSQQFGGSQSQIATLRSDIVRGVSDTLRGSIPEVQLESAAGSGTTDAEAFRLYLKARFFWNKRTGEALLKAEELYKQAIERDPSYGQAYAGLAETYAIQQFYSVAAPDQSMPKAAAAARKALEIDETIAEAHAALGLYLLYYKWDPEASERELRKAIELNPNYATGYHWLANGPLVTRGRFDEAVAVGNKAEDLDPLSVIVITDSGWNLAFARRYDQALEKLKKALTLDPNFVQALFTKGLVHYLSGSYEEAITNFQSSLERSDDSYTKALLACALIKAGRRAEALVLLEELESNRSGGYVPLSGLALIYGALGDMDKAISYIDRDLADRADNPFGRSIDPVYDDLRKDPRFDQVLAKYKRRAPLK